MEANISIEESQGSELPTQRVLYSSQFKWWCAMLYRWCRRDEI